MWVRIFFLPQTLLIPLKLKMWYYHCLPPWMPYSSLPSVIFQHPAQRWSSARTIQPTLTSDPEMLQCLLWGCSVSGHELHVRVSRTLHSARCLWAACALTSCRLWGNAEMKWYPLEGATVTWWLPVTHPRLSSCSPLPSSALFRQINLRLGFLTNKLG